MTRECLICGTANDSEARVCNQCRTPFEPDAGAAPEDATLAQATIDAAALAVPTTWNTPSSRKPSGSLETGSLLGGRYEIRRLLGEGGMGSVFQAYDRELDRVVALKVVRPEWSSNADVLRRFKQELILARQVTHRNVIRIFDLGVADGRRFITMEFVEGQNLGRILSEEGRLRPERAIALIRQVLAGLQAAHSEGVVHRDLKPQNVVVDGHGRAWLMDFGIARSTEVQGLTRTGALLGTPDYMSPEQARGGRIDTRSDLFSAGVLFYEMLTGTQPYRSKTIVETLLKLTKQKPPAVHSLVPGVSEALSAIVARAMEIDREQRYQSAAEMLRDLDRSEAQTADLSSSAVTQITTPVPGELEPGSRFGARYEIEAVLGEGGMGKVYRACDHELGRTVALKIVRPELTDNAGLMQLLKQEILLASRITHRNILRIYDLGEVNGQKFISMAYVEGKDLHALLLEQGKLPFERALHIARQISRALEAAHAEGIIHRDLKPQNVLLGPGDEVFVSDFGLAKTFEAGADAGGGEMMGTPRYMSPEQAEAKPLDRRTDLYSFGLILYEMFTGDLPFQSETVFQAIYERVAGPPRNPRVLRPDLPDAYVTIVMRCLERDPEKRYQAASEILADLDRPPETRRVVTLGLPRRPWIIAVAALLLLAGASALLVPELRHAVLPGKGKTDVTAEARNAKFVAVLPFRVNGADEAQAYIAAGITDSLSARLMQLKSVRLTSPVAAARADLKEPLDQLGRSLGAKLLIQGSVQAEKDRINVIVSLDEPATGKRLWSEQFSGVTQDLLTVQDHIYSKLAAALELKPTTEEAARIATAPTENIAAYEDYARGLALLRKRRDGNGVQQALQLFESSAAKDPQFALAYTGIADSALYLYGINKNGALAERALNAARRAADLNDTLPEVHFALGRVYTVTGKNAQAVAELKQALKLAPNSDEGYRRLGRAYLDMGKNKEGVEAFQKAIDVNPYLWSNYNALGTAYFQLGDNANALTTFRRVTELEPEKAIGWANIGVILYRQDQWTESIPAFQKALKLEPQADIYSNLGTAYFFLHRYSEARDMFAHAVELTPGDFLAQGNLADAYRWMGEGYREKSTEAYEKAIALALKALDVNPRDAATLSALGTYYAKRKYTAHALGFIRRARSIDPSSPDLLYKNCVIDALAGRTEEAVTNLKLALEAHYPVKEAANDPELDTLKGSPEFQKLIAPGKGSG